jgi:hypothetical protein
MLVKKNLQIRTTGETEGQNRAMSLRKIEEIDSTWKCTDRSVREK